MSTLGKFSWTDFKGALVSGVLMALLAMGLYIMQIGNIFEIDTQNLINIGVMAGITSLVSLLKSCLTNSDGKFVGVVSVK